MDQKHSPNYRLQQFTAYISSHKLLSVCVILLVGMGCRSHYPLANKPFVVHANETSLERGKNLTYNVCGQCHYDYKGTRKFTGRKIEELPKILGTIYSADLTNNGILKTYTDEQLVYLLKTGISNKGKFIPYMIRPTMADKDLNDIVAYLRSGDEPLKSDRSTGNRTHITAIGKMGMKMTGKPTPYISPIAGPDESDPIAYGRYLVDIIGCYHCHSKSIMGLDYIHPEQSKGYMAGGMKFRMPGYKVRASNLTPCDCTGIGTYSKEEFRKALHEKIAKDGRELKEPMPKFPHLTDKQVDAIYAYLMKLPAQYHHIKGHEYYK